MLVSFVLQSLANPGTTYFLTELRLHMLQVTATRPCAMPVGTWVADMVCRYVAACSRLWKRLSFADKCFEAELVPAVIGKVGWLQMRKETREK